MLVSAAGAAGAHYYYIVEQTFQNQVLIRENRELRDRLSGADHKLDEVQQKLAKVDVLSQKLREITRLSDPTRGLAIGPVQEPLHLGGSFDYRTGVFSVPPMQEDPLLQKLEYDLLEARLYGLDTEARRQEASLRELSRYFEEQSSLLSSTPSIEPVRGWITSEFGMRDDPYTGARAMHHGIDISTPEGKPFVAPASGTVVFSGPRGNYGNIVVIEHGLGVSTFYAHLKESLVNVGEEVKRGQNIGTVGNTGRSTGPHLHYEIRVHGMPINPRAYILN